MNRSREIVIPKSAATAYIEVEDLTSSVIDKRGPNIAVFVKQDHPTMDNDTLDLWLTTEEFRDLVAKFQRVLSEHEAELECAAEAARTQLAQA